MDVKQAVHVAKTYLSDLLSEEKVAALTLEEVWFDDSHGQWCITLGVHRQLGIALTGLTGMPSFKSVRVADADGHVISVRNRTSEAA